MRPYHLEIVTPDGLEFDGQVESLLVHTDDGDMEILAGHADLLATVAIGRARIRVDGVNRFASAAGGFLTVRDGEVKLVATTFEFAEDIDLNRAKAAAEAARKSLETARDEGSELIAKAKLARALNRINISEKI